MEPAVVGIAGSAYPINSSELKPSFKDSDAPPAYNGGAEKAWKEGKKSGDQAVLDAKAVTDEQAKSPKGVKDEVPSTVNVPK
tara:strand:+ start:327 stop:572 length:246 start_codon:yes stop_codon:yes gene_type:complete